MNLVPSNGCGKLADLGNVPPQFGPNGSICEEVHINPDTASFITKQGNRFQLRGGQAAAATNGVDIQLPTTSIEVKVDWIPSTAFKAQYQFTCSKPPIGVYVEEINNVCYALAGMHIESKLLKNWLWATFEPQNSITNPSRCKVYTNNCRDVWGSDPAESHGDESGFTAQTAALKALMLAAGLPNEFSNYRLVGVQTDFVTTAGPKLLGNSVIEYENAGVSLPPNGASCISCHALSAVRTDGVDSFSSVFQGQTILTDRRANRSRKDEVGPQFHLPNGWAARDFIWSMQFGHRMPQLNALKWGREQAVR